VGISIGSREVPGRYRPVTMGRIIIMAARKIH
jgi:hypothetical protein